MSHDPFAASRRNAKRRSTTPADRTDQVPGHPDEMIAWINQATDLAERRKRAELVAQAERQSASPRREVLAAAKAAVKPSATATVPGAKRRASRTTQTGPVVNIPEGMGPEEARQAGKETARGLSEALAERTPEPEAVPEGARGIVAWIRDASTSDQARRRAEAAMAAEIERNGTVRPTVQAAIDKAT